MNNIIYYICLIQFSSRKKKLMYR